MKKQKDFNLGKEIEEHLENINLEAWYQGHVYASKFFKKSD